MEESEHQLAKLEKVFSISLLFLICLSTAFPQTVDFAKFYCKILSFPLLTELLWYILVDKLVVTSIERCFRCKPSDKEVNPVMKLDFRERICWKKCNTFGL